MNDYVSTDEYPLIKECLSGDRDKYAVLVDRYKTMVYTVAYRMLGDADAANDMAQESFISAYAGLKGFHFGSKFSSWLYRIAVNKCRDYLRGKKEMVSLDAIAEVSACRDVTPEEAASCRQTEDVVQKALNMLPEDYREIIILKHIEELDYKEIAAILGVGVNALKVRSHRGREMLKKILQEKTVAAQ